MQSVVFEEVCSGVQGHHGPSLSIQRTAVVGQSSAFVYRRSIGRSAPEAAINEEPSECVSLPYSDELTPNARGEPRPRAGARHDRSCWASAPVPGSVCREAREFSGRRSCPRAVSVCTPRISRSSETPVVVRVLQRAHSPHPNTLLFRTLSSTVSGPPRQHGPTHGDETDGGSISNFPPPTAAEEAPETNRGA
jgi:hypothetical protein